MKKLDEWILNLCTKFSHWLQRTTGLTNYFVAKIGVAVAFLAALSWIIIIFKKYLFNEISIFSVMLFFLLCSYLITQFIKTIYYMDDLRARLDSEPEEIRSVTTEIILYEFFHLRLSFIPITVFDFFYISLPGYLYTKSLALEIIRSLLCPGVLVLLYFIAVNPLPPGKNKIREWLKQFSFKQLEPVPIPKD